MVTPSACVKTTIRTLAGSLSVPRLTPETTTSLPVVADAMIPPMIPLISMRLPWTICPLQSKVSSRGQGCDAGEESHVHPQVVFLLDTQRRVSLSSARVAHYGRRSLKITKDFDEGETAPSHPCHIRADGPFIYGIQTGSTP
jgi:hypothetical protein